MTSQSFRGVVQGQTILVLEQPAPLPDGTLVEIRPLTYAVDNAAAVLAAMRAEPHLTAEDIAELNRALAEGERGAPMIDPFGDDATGTENV